MVKVQGLIINRFGRSLDRLLENRVFGLTARKRPIAYREQNAADVARSDTVVHVELVGGSGRAGLHLFEPAILGNARTLGHLNRRLPTRR